jgi:hypothetical protein
MASTKWDSGQKYMQRKVLLCAPTMLIKKRANCINMEERKGSPLPYRIVQGFVQNWAISLGRGRHACHAPSTASFSSSWTFSGSKDTW